MARVLIAGCGYVGTALGERLVDDSHVTWGLRRIAASLPPRLRAIENRTSFVRVANTGISGPGGGSDEKPVGLVHLALSQAEGTQAAAFVFPLDRVRHRQLTAQVALDWVRRSLLGEPLEGPTLLRRRGGASAPGSPGAGGAKR